MEGEGEKNSSPTRSETLFDINESLATGYVIVVAILIIVGVAGNILVLINMKKEKKINIHARKFILNIAVADLCVSAIANPMCIAGAVLGSKHLNGNFWFCVMIASMCLTACICVFLNLVALTVNRWLYICHNGLHNKFFGHCTTNTLCVMTWVLGFGAELPNFFGWAGHFFDEKSHQCIWDRKGSRSYTLFVTIGLISSPFVLLGYCNAAMFYTIWKGKRNIFGLKGIVWTKAISSSRTLLVMYFVFLICWTPYVVVLLADATDAFTFEIHLFVTLLAHSHSSTAFFVYFFVMRNFRTDVLKLLRLSNRIEPLFHTSVSESAETKSAAIGTQVTDATSAKRSSRFFNMNMPGNTALLVQSKA